MIKTEKTPMAEAGRVAYQAYCRMMPTSDGRLPKSWATLNRSRRMAFEAAAQAAVMALGHAAYTSYEQILRTEGKRAEPYDQLSERKRLAFEAMACEIVQKMFDVENEREVMIQDEREKLGRCRSKPVPLDASTVATKI